MGLFSSAQLVRFLAMDVRPNALRSISRALPPRAARGLVGRLMADPAFAHKLGFEIALTSALSVYWEARARGDAFWAELDFVALNTAVLALAGAAGVWAAAPSRAPALGGANPWSTALAGVPNHAFDASSPGRAFGTGARAASLAARGLELALLGGAAGAAMAGGGSALTALHRRATGDEAYTPSAPVPAASTTLAMAAAGGLVANARLQLLGGVDRALFEHAGTLASYFVPALALRVGAAIAAFQTRVEAQGLGWVLPARDAARAEVRAAAEAAAAARRPRTPAGPPRRKRLVRKVGAGAPPGAAAVRTAALHPGSAGEAVPSTSSFATTTPSDAAGSAAAEGGLPPPRGPRKAAVPTGREAGEGVAPPRRRKEKKAPAGFSISASA
jgi:hypothetical protein